MTSPEQTPTQEAGKHRVTHRTQVLEAIHQLHSLDVKYINIEAIMRTTGLLRTQVYDAVKDLKNVTGQIHSPQDGLYLPTDSQPPSQAVSVLALAHGGVKIEKGDVILELTPHEWTYQLAPLAAGASAHAAVMEHVQRTIALAGQIEKLKTELRAVKDILSDDGKQLPLSLPMPGQ